MQLEARPRPQRDRGVVLKSMDDAGRIDGVEFHPRALWPDDRGWFSELFRFGDSQAEAGARWQISAAQSFPGIVKAMHFHRLQTDWWVPLSGHFQIALFDMRRESPTWGGVNTLFAGEAQPLCIRIPPGVGHGYKVLGLEPGLMVYATDRHYDPADEGRLAWNDAGLNYDWETRHG